MALVDVSAMVEKIRNHRFDGYTDTGIATEIEKFKSGDGIGSIGTAVEALRSVSGALAETDVTLRRELSKMGVEWQSQAGGQAGQVFTEQAGFSRDAMDKVEHSAEMIFAQGEAFNRTLYKLPDAATVRKGAGGLTLGDKALSLIGFETDHVRDVVAAKNARAQAVEALNAYATQSGENLSSVESMAEPQGLMLDSAEAGGPSALQLAGSAVDLTPGGGKGETPGDTRAAAADCKDTGPVSQSASKPHVAVPQHDAPTPAMGIQAPSRSSGGSSAPPPPPPPSESTTPSGSAPHAPGGTGGVAPRPPSHQEPGRPFPPGTPGTPGIPGAPGTPGTPPLPGMPGVSGPSVGSVLGGQASGSENPAGRFGGGPGGSGGPGGPGGGSGAEGSRGFPGGAAGITGGGGDQALGKGKLVGAGPQTPIAAAEVGRPFPPLPKPGMSAGDLGAGAAALGAGAVGGATSGERDRQGRGFGRGAVSSGKPLGQLPMGELPEEEAAAMRNSEKLSPRKEKGNASFMETAAPQNPHDEEDASHVRRYGVDDKDLFADGRLVSPDLIGDDGADETR